MSAIRIAVRRALAYAAVAGVAVAPTIGWTQSSGSTNQPTTTTSPKSATTTAPMSATTVESTADAAAKPAGRTDKYARVRVQELIGMDVRDNGGRRVGDVEDLMIDTANGRVSYAVVGYGGFMGLGERLYAYPTSAFSSDLRSGTLTLKLPGERLTAADGFERDNWPADASYWERIQKVFSDERTPADAKRPNLVRASVLVGMDVNDSRGQDVGEVEDVIVNLGQRKVDDVVLSFDKRWNPDDKLLALPMKEFQPLTADAKELTVKRDREALRQAPTFDRSQWPDLAQGGLRDRYASYWNNAPTPQTAHSAAFRQLDTNSDGFLSAQEYQASFGRLDSDRDGRISAAEMIAQPGPSGPQAATEDRPARTAPPTDVQANQPR
jgi:sporulation protein YlmC with PRC-barrel domain